jgi:hypothetical protein
MSTVVHFDEKIESPDRDHSCEEIDCQSMYIDAVDNGSILENSMYWM